MVVRRHKRWVPFSFLFFLARPSVGPTTRTLDTGAFRKLTFNNWHIFGHVQSQVRYLSHTDKWVPYRPRKPQSIILQSASSIILSGWRQLEKFPRHPVKKSGSLRNPAGPVTTRVPFVPVTYCNVSEWWVDTPNVQCAQGDEWAGDLDFPP